MTLNRSQETALAFFEAYSDPEIDKRLHFDVWADRTGLSMAEKRTVWRDVLRLTYRFAAQKREATRQRKVSARSPFVGAANHRRAGGGATAA